LTIVKLDPGGVEVARYDGTVVAAGVPPWIAVRAVWAHRLVELDGLRFVPGDTLIEYFSPVDPFNGFAVYAPDGALRGWYANVTFPTHLDPATDPPTLTWHDLFLDVVALPDGAIALRDDDELAAADVAARDPSLHRMILAAREEIVARLRRGEVPFDAVATRSLAPADENIPQNR
jgi:predicted RNA-binding protein associated with RNAse of E/G family